MKQAANREYKRQQTTEQLSDGWDKAGVAEEAVYELKQTQQKEKKTVTKKIQKEKREKKQRIEAEDADKWDQGDETETEEAKDQEDTLERVVAEKRDTKTD